MRPTRAAFGTGLGLLAFVASVGAALITGSRVSAVTLAVETFASDSAQLLDTLGRALPLGYAFAAGMLAAVNPCGIALLPAYLGMYLGLGSASPALGPGSHTPNRAVMGALRVSAVVTLSFVVLFGAVGLVLSAVAQSLVVYLPWAGLAAGMLLILAGGALLAGSPLYVALPEQLADRLSGRLGGAGWTSYGAFGLTFGLSSLGCTLPIFLTVVGTALTTRGIVEGLLQFVLYALGMGFLLTCITLSALPFSRLLLGPARQFGRYLEPVAAFLLLITGGYVVYYWLTIGGLLRG